MDNLNALINPNSIAIFGASSNLNKISGRPLRYLKEFDYQGEIYPINPKYDEIAGIKCYPSLAAVGKPIDLAIVGVAAQYVVEAIKDCAQHGVRSALIFSSGFAEIGEEGIKLQDAIKEIIQTTGMRVCGPNCIGFTNLSKRLPGTFSSVVERIKDDIPGNLGFITQSGAFGVMIYALARESGSFFKYFINTGNEVDVDLADCLDYMVKDTDIKVIGGYCEGIRNTDKFLQAAEAAEKAKKPVAILKVGKSAVGALAASKHTGSVVGSDQIYAAVFKQKGIAQAENLDELLDILTIAAKEKYPAGNRVAIVTISGGAGILISDVCDEAGLKVPPLTGRTYERIAELIPYFGSAMNPVDVTADLINNHDSLEECLNLLVEDESIDSVLIFISLFDHVAEVLVDIIDKVNKKTQKPVVVAWSAAKSGIIPKLINLGVPAYPDGGRAAKALAAMNFFAEGFRRRDADELDQEKNLVGTKVREVMEYINSIKAKGIMALSHNEARELLGYYNLSLEKNEQISPSHKNKKWPVEYVIKMQQDPTFGPVIVFGIGSLLEGRFEELALRLPPLSQNDAYELLKDIKAPEIKAAVMKDSYGLVDILVRVSELCNDLKGELAQLRITILGEPENMKIKGSTLILNNAVSS
ncbi:MAG: CoA-binding protein, partial [Bacillota bacterium]|nr:CoA-binding protein [Bacillota bacterium]